MVRKVVDSTHGSLFKTATVPINPFGKELRMCSTVFTGLTISENQKPFDCLQPLLQLPNQY